MLTVDPEETPETDTDEDDADIAHGPSIKTSGCALTAGVLVAICGSCSIVADLVGCCKKALITAAELVYAEGSKEDGKINEEVGGEIVESDEIVDKERHG